MGLAFMNIPAWSQYCKIIMFLTNGFRVYEHSGVVQVVQHSLLVFSTNGFRVYEHSGVVLVVQHSILVFFVQWV